MYICVGDMMIKKIKILAIIFIIQSLMFELYGQDLDKSDLSISRCGLNYFFKTAKIASRTDLASLPLPVGTQPVKFNITELKSGECYKVEKAFIIWTVSFKENSPLVPAVNIIDPNGKSFKVEAQMIGEDRAKAWAEVGTRSFLADVTDLITINGDYSFSVSTNDWETDGICLFVCHSDLKADYEGHLYINYGLVTNPKQYYKNLSPLDVCETDNDGKAFMLVSDLQPHKQGAGNWDFNVFVRMNNTDILMNREFFSMFEINQMITQGQVNSQFGLESKYLAYPAVSDFFSISLIGIYYQSTLCTGCPVVIKNEINSNILKDSACKGTIVDVVVNTNADSVYWTNISGDYISSGNFLQVKLDSIQKYICHSSIGDDCITKNDTITLTAINPPKLDFDTLALVCGGTPTKIGGVATGEGMPFTYLWEPPTGLSDPTIANPFVTTTSEIEYLLTVSDRFGCIESRKVKVLMSEGADVVLISDTTICSGTLFEIIPTISGGQEPYNIQWTPNQYFQNPNSQNQQLLIDSTVNLKITVTDAKGCITEAELSINVPEPISITLVDSVANCFGDSVFVDVNILSGRMPLNFNWEFDSDVNFPNDSSLAFLPIESNYLYLTVTDSIGCTRSDSIFVQVNPLPEPLIIGNRNLPLCTCDSIVLSVDSNYPNIKWSTGDSTASIIVKDEGVYSVSVTDSNGCINSAIPFVVEKIRPFTRISFDKKIYYSNNAEIITVYIQIDSSSFMNDCVFDKFYTQLKLNKSLLVPLEDSEFGIISGKDRFITIEKKYNNSINYLDSLTFIATLGDADSTLIEFEEFYWTNCDYNKETINSLYIPTDICRADSISRLFLSGNANQKIMLYPNPANNLLNFEYYSNENESITFEVIDILGKLILSREFDPIANRKTALLIDTYNFENGIYFIKISNGYNIYTNKFIISK